MSFTSTIHTMGTPRSFTTAILAYNSGGHRPVANRHMRLRARAECGNGGVQRRDPRRHASLHHVTSPTWRPATLRRRPVSMTRRRHGMPHMVRAFMALISRETALINAAEASEMLRKRRHDREEVDAYLRALHSPIPADTR
jgi:hypothetical protein